MTVLMDALMDTLKGTHLGSGCCVVCKGPVSFGQPGVGFLIKERELIHSGECHYEFVRELMAAENES